MATRNTCYSADDRKYQVLAYLAIEGPQTVTQLAKGIAFCTDEKPESIRSILYRVLKTNEGTGLEDLKLVVSEHSENGRILNITPYGLALLWLALKKPWKEVAALFTISRYLGAERIRGLDLAYAVSRIRNYLVRDFIEGYFNEICSSVEEIVVREQLEEGIKLVKCVPKKDAKIFVRIVRTDNGVSLDIKVNTCKLIKDIHKYVRSSAKVVERLDPNTFKPIYGFIRLYPITKNVVQEIIKYFAEEYSYRCQDAAPSLSYGDLLCCAMKRDLEALGVEHKDEETCLLVAILDRLVERIAYRLDYFDLVFLATYLHEFSEKAIEAFFSAGLPRDVLEPIEFMIRHLRVVARVCKEKGYGRCLELVRRVFEIIEPEMREIIKLYDELHKILYEP